MGRSKREAPVWARALVAKVCHDANIEKIPHIRWTTRPKNQHSTGTAYNTFWRIDVRAGTDWFDQQSTVLHELAHLLVPSGCGHNDLWARTLISAFLQYSDHPFEAIQHEILFVRNGPIVLQTYATMLADSAKLEKPRLMLVQQPNKKRLQLAPALKAEEQRLKDNGFFRTRNQYEYSLAMDVRHEITEKLAIDFGTYPVAARTGEVSLT